jgi:serine/threonine protein kinase
MLIRGKYELLEEIGRGNFGNIYSAINIKTNSIVAIKVENKSHKILKHEITVLNYLNYNKCYNVPMVHWYGITEVNEIKYACAVIDYFPISFSQYIKENIIIGKELDLMMQKMLDIMKRIHDKLVIHRDIKPDNFMLNNKKELILIDFGLSTFHLTDEKMKTSDDLSIKNKFIGNIIYASPNIHKHENARKVDDIISIAYIYLLIFLGGTLPWMNINGSSIIDDEGSKLKQVLYLKETFLNEQDKKLTIFIFLKKLYCDKVSYSFG